MSILTREPLPVQRTRFVQLSSSDVDYYRRQSSYYGQRYEYTCHGCGHELGGGERYCNLVNTSNDYAVWCRDCANAAGWELFR